SPRVLPPPSAVSSPVNRLPSGSVYVPSGSGWMRRILPLRLLVLPAVRRASAKDAPLKFGSGVLPEPPSLKPLALLSPVGMYGLPLEAPALPPPASQQLPSCTGHPSRSS